MVFGRRRNEFSRIQSLTTKLFVFRSRMVVARRVICRSVGRGGVFPFLNSWEKDLMILLWMGMAVSPSSTYLAMVFSQNGCGFPSCSVSVWIAHVCECWFFSRRVFP